MTERCFLYRHYDSNGVLLYVGISLNPIVRLSGHRKVSPWFEQISQVRIEMFESRELALSAERSSIQKEKPLYNKKYNSHAIEVRSNERPRPRTDDLPGYLSVDQVATVLRTSCKYVERLVRKGAIKFAKTGRARMVHESELERFIESIKTWHTRPSGAAQ